MPSHIYVNHLGFTPHGAKYFVVTDPPQEEFTVVRRVPSREPVLTARLKRMNADLGEAWVGDFSSIQAEGNYLVQCGDLQSRPITIYSGIYQQPLRTLFNYFSQQRCGDSLTGWHAPCHVHDARRVDNGEHVDVTGGWHQSCDLRKWTFGTSFGLVALAQFGMRPAPRWAEGRIGDEVRWGNGYFHKMVRADGGLMDHVVVPLGWGEERDLYANDAPGMATYMTLAGQAMIAELFQESDPEYSRACLAVAERMWAYIAAPDSPRTQYSPPIIPRYHEWMPGFFSQNYPGSALDHGDALYACMALYQATKEAKWLEAARSRAAALIDLQVGEQSASSAAAACFRVGPGQAEYAHAYTDGFFGPMGLCELLAAQPEHADAPRWRTAIQRIVDQQLAGAARNPWGVIPVYWYAEDPGGARKAGDAYFKYFYRHDTFNVGINADILGCALFLLRAGRLLGDPRCFAVACRQVDWVLGCNPLDASTVEGVGRNQPERLINGDEFFPPVPQIPGAVMTGAVGDANDEMAPFRMGVDSEYDMPPTSMLIWAMLEIAEAAPR